MKPPILIAALALLAAGCSHAPMGQVGQLRFTEVNSVGILGPSTKIIVVETAGKTNSAEVLKVVSGPGLIPAGANAGGLAGAAALVRPDRTEVNTSAGAAAASQSNNIRNNGARKH